MVREQLSELTGRRSDIGASDDSIYKQLLTNAVSGAQEFACALAWRSAPTRSAA